MPIESEIKLRLDLEFLAQVGEHPLVAEGAVRGPTEQLLQSTYFDTPDLRILAQGMGLRIRRVGKRWFQTLKGGGAGEAGLHRRQEWEGEVASPTPALDLLAEDAKSGILRERDLVSRLIPVFETDFRRTVWWLQGSDGSRIELALDEGHIRSQGRVEPLSELELELKQGRERDLYRVALRLAEAFPVAVEHASKAERGYRLYRQRFSPLRAPGPAPLKPDTDPIGLGYWLARLQYGERLLLERHDPQGIKHLRTAAEALRQGLTDANRKADPLCKDLDWLLRGLQAQKTPAQIRSWVSSPCYSRLLLCLGAYRASL